MSTLSLYKFVKYKEKEHVHVYYLFVTKRVQRLLGTNVHWYIIYRQILEE